MKIISFFRSIKYGILNLIKWFKVIWNDRWWDYTFLYTILRFKLADMENGFNKYGCSANSKKDAAKIRKCIDLIDKLLEDNYFEKYEGEEAIIEREKDTKRLFLIIANNIDCWWD